MAKAYFKKSFISNKLRLASGKTIDWVEVGRELGVLETEDDDLAQRLAKLSDEGRFGVSKIDAAEFEELKKNSGQTSPRPQSEWQPRVTNPIPEPVEKVTSAQRSKKSSVAGAARPKGKAEASEGPTVTKGAVPEPAT